MKVFVREISGDTPYLFTECDPLKLDELIAFIKASGGFYASGAHREFNSYQLVIDDDKAFAEILVGE